MTIGGMTAQDNISLELDKNSLVIIPKDADFSDTEASLSYELDENAPDHAIARILYEYQGHSIGQVYLCSAAHTQANTENISAGSQALAAQTETGTAAPAETPEQKEIPDANARSSAQTRSSASKKAFPFLLVGICSAALIIVGVILFLLLHSHRKEKKICSCAVSAVWNAWKISVILLPILTSFSPRKEVPLLLTKSRHTK